ncbi:MAG: NAD(P)H-hydrate dehydratase, partial [Pseudomonadota bacterium]
LYFDDLQVPAGVYETQTPAAQRIDPQRYDGLLRPRERNSNKGRFGHVLVIGGERGMSGAARMAGEAAARTGAGLVSVATRDCHASMLNLTVPELMVRGVESADALAPLLERATVIAIGPGLGQTEWSRSLLEAVLHLPHPMVVDADALNLLATDPRESDQWVLTPHPGEAARLLHCDTETIQSDRYAAAASLQQRYGGVCVLKGAGTLVASKERVAVCNTGNPGMASGGMGDVLTGVIAGLLAQGLSPVDAAELGVWVHGAAGDAAAAQGERGMLASDLFPHLRQRLNP